MRVRNHCNPFTVQNRFERLNEKDFFSKKREKLCYEIGFGKGVFIRQYAQDNPEHNIIGIEVRKAMVQTLKERLSKAPPLENLHLLHGNGEIALEDLFPDNSLDNVFVFHPDPWFKKKHNKRRVVNSKFLETLYKKIKEDGKFYLSTDVATLWDSMQETILNSQLFEPIEDSEFWKDTYFTHWQTFSQKESRNQFKACFKPRPTPH